MKDKGEDGVWHGFFRVIFYWDEPWLRVGYYSGRVCLAAMNVNYFFSSFSFFLFFYGFSLLCFWFLYLFSLLFSLFHEIQPYL